MSWRDIPEPDTLAHVLRSTGGLPVPFVAAWSSEQDYVIRPDALVRGEPSVFSSGRRGDGEPLFGEMEASRQRHCVLKRRYQVCNHRCPDGLAVDGPGLGQDAVVGIDAARAILEPWVCAPCLEYALRVCPGLVTKNAREEISILLVERAVPIATMTRLPDGRTGWGYVKLGVVQARAYDPIVWLDTRRRQAA